MGVSNYGVLLFMLSARYSADDDDNYDEMTDLDCLSSNKLGVTYTESGMSGISFNYSELYG
jgi:hypothetical protein